MNSRIQKFIEAEHLTPAKLADSIGVQRSNISHILSGRNKPGFEFIEKLLKTYPHLNADWLILGKGNMYREAFSPSLFPIEGAGKNDNSPAIEIETNNTIGINNVMGQNNVTAAVLPSKNKIVNRIMVLYSDGTFDTYLPSNAD